MKITVILCTYNRYQSLDTTTEPSSVPRFLPQWNGKYWW